MRKNIDILLSKFDYQLISFQKNFENIDNLKYFKKLNNINLKKKRVSRLIEVPKIKNNYYLFSKSKKVDLLKKKLFTYFSLFKNSIFLFIF